MVSYMNNMFEGAESVTKAAIISFILSGIYVHENVGELVPLPRTSVPRLPSWLHTSGADQHSQVSMDINSRETLIEGKTAAAAEIAEHRRVIEMFQAGTLLEASRLFVHFRFEELLTSPISLRCSLSAGSLLSLMAGVSFRQTVMPFR